jgi:hypothetical protein
MSDKSNPLLSNIAPPTELPSFIVQQKSPSKEEASESSTSKFTAAIPAADPVKPAEAAEKNETSDGGAGQVLDELPSMQDIAEALSPITEGVKNSVLFGWMKSGVKTGVQKAKDSIDKVVTVLDPQMAQLICEYAKF